VPPATSLARAEGAATSSVSGPGQNRARALRHLPASGPNGQRTCAASAAISGSAREPAVLHGKDAAPRQPRKRIRGKTVSVSVGIATTPAVTIHVAASGCIALRGTRNRRTLRRIDQSTIALCTNAREHAIIARSTKKHTEATRRRRTG